MSRRRNLIIGGRRGAGFTFLEVLLVVVIMAVLAGAVVPHYLSSANDAKQSAMSHNLYLMQAQFELYRAQHGNQYPTIVNNMLPQLTSATDAAGDIGPAGPQFPYGPYVIEAPTNPYDGSTCVTPVPVPGQQPTGVVGTLGGWLYDQSNGAVLAEQPGVIPVADGLGARQETLLGPPAVLSQHRDNRISIGFHGATCRRRRRRVAPR